MPVEYTTGRLRRALGGAMVRGFRGRCPNCGEGRLFRAYLKVVDRCAACGTELFHQRADDAPPYFVTLITGHVVVPGALAVEVAFAPPLWMHALIWGPLTIAMALGLLQPVKGAIVGWQWATYMHGFDPDYVPDDLPPQDRRPEDGRP